MTTHEADIAIQCLDMLVLRLSEHEPSWRLARPREYHAICLTYKALEDEMRPSPPEDQSMPELT